jgi:creatinine amidohydrolase
MKIFFETMGCPKNFNDTQAAQGLLEKGIPAVVAPTFAVANSMHHMNFPGSMSLRPRTYMKALQEQCRAIAAHGFKRMAIINGHGGNIAPTKAALVDINIELGFPVYFLDYIVVPEAPYLDTQKGMVHACESETSLMLAYDETLVDPIYKETSGYAGGCTRHEDEGVLHTFHRMEAHTVNGVMGNSYAATKEKGEILADVNTKKLVEILSDDVIWQMKV